MHCLLHSFGGHVSVCMIGKFVHVSLKQISIADPEALHEIYSYSAGTLKGDIYDGFVLPGRKPSIFATRQRDEHSRKRKYLSHVMSMKSVQDLEHNILHHQRMLVQQWDKLCLDGVKDQNGSKGSCEWKAREGRVWFNCMPCKWSSHRPPACLSLIIPKCL